MAPDDRVLINRRLYGQRLRHGGLVDIVKKAGAGGHRRGGRKGQGGGIKFPRHAGYPLKALAVIESADENGIIFRG